MLSAMLLARRVAVSATVTILAFALFPQPAGAVPGALDSTFSGDGKVTTNFTANNDEAVAITIQTDGKIIAGGGTFFTRAPGFKSDFALARYNTNGTLDTSFSGDGKVTTNLVPGDDWINALAVQADGKILAVGGAGPTDSNERSFALARYNTNGTLDTSFSGDGKVTTNFTPGYDYVEDVALQADGKIVVAGSAAGDGLRFALARYNADGTLDTSFSGDGKLTTELNSGNDIATAVAVQGDGRIVAAGWSGPANGKDYRFALVRYTTDGVLDGSFSGDGKAFRNFSTGYDFAWDMVVQPDGKLVLVGTAEGAGGRFALARFNSDGTTDDTFSGDGNILSNPGPGYDVLTGVSVDGDGRIVAAGWTGPATSNDYRFAVVRYSGNGTADLTFGSSGMATTNFTTGNDYAWDMALQSDGRIVAVGRAGGQGGRFALARYLAA
jgi:uncharacterized delta-60 repeat protein